MRATPWAAGRVSARSISFTDEDLHGGLYYWAAADGKIVRYDFGKRGQTAESFYTAGQAGSLCVGCHALARNGERIAVGLNAPIPTAGLRVLDIATKTSLYDGASNFAAFSPDASRALVNAGGDLALLNVSSGQVAAGPPAITDGNLPDWSADGTKVVFARSGACPVPFLCASQPGVSGANLFTVPVTGDSFGPPVPLVTGGGNNFYPAFSPDGSLIAFNRSASNANSFDAKDARVWVVGAGGGTPVALTNASSTGATVGDSWPKVAPYSHHFKGETIFDIPAQGTKGKTTMASGAKMKTVRRDMQVVHTRTGKKLRLSNSQRLFARDRETVDEAYPGDIVGLVGNNDFLIGDTLSEEPDLAFSEMPRFAPESFAFLHNDTPAHFKRFRDGLTQLLKEGVVQTYDQPDALVRVPLIGAVGPLQFDVLQYRLESEYGAKSRLESTPWGHIRWVREKDKAAAAARSIEKKPAAQIPTGATWARDVFGQWVVLLPSAWTAKYFADNNSAFEVSPLPF